MSGVVTEVLAGIVSSGDAKVSKIAAQAVASDMLAELDAANTPDERKREIVTLLMRANVRPFAHVARVLLLSVVNPKVQA